MKTYKLIMSVLFILLSFNVIAQYRGEFGINTGFIRFYPDVEFFSQGLNNRADNGFGWSAGIYYEKQWKSKIKPVLELNYSNLSSDFYLETSSYNSETGGFEQPQSDVFHNVSFRYLSGSAGIKFYLNKKLFVYPGFELAKPLNRKLDLWSLTYYSRDWNFVKIKNKYMEKTNYYAKLGFGVDLNVADVILEYVYGLNYQLSFFEYSDPFGVNNRNTYLQLKVQVPLYRLR